MAAPRRGPIVAGLLSLAVPGVGQLFVGKRRLGLLLLAASVAAAFALIALASWWEPAIDRRLVAAVLGVDLALLGLRCYAVADAAHGVRMAVLVGLVALTAAPHVAAGYVAVRGYGVLENVFAEEEPEDVLGGNGLFLDRTVPLPRWVAKDSWELALVERLGSGELAPLERSPRVLADGKPGGAKPWTTILLLGTDEGPGNWGARTDTIIVAAIQHGTRRAAAFGIPRNFAQVPLGRKRSPSKEPLNALYGLNGGGAQGASVLKQAVSNLLGIRVDYYALVNLLGFADLVDALGGVEIDVNERLHDEVTRPAWGEPKPTIDVVPGRTYRFYGREALAYVRSRKDSSDYTRMARQRCFLSAMADQLDPVHVLRNFGSLAKTIETNVHTDIPLNRLPSLVRLVSGLDPKQTLTVTFGPEYFFGRRKQDRHPVPNLHRIQTTVRQAILTPELSTKALRATTTRRSC
jgi:LCP family protein required for cell wall assembly